MLPNEWESLRLTDVAEFITSGSRDWAQYYSDEGSKFIRMTNLPRDGIYLKLDDLKYVDVKSNSADGKRTSLQAGDILISITAELGKMGWVPENFGEAYINQHTALVRLRKSKSDAKFIAYLLSSHAMRHRIERLNDSGAKAGLNLSTIRSIPFLLPPLPEQRKIAKILSTWDKAIATTEKLIATSKQQKKALMQQLLSGKNRLVNSEMGRVFEGDWEKVKLGDISDIKGGKRLPKGESLQEAINNYPYIRVADMYMGGISIKKILYVPEHVAPTIKRYTISSSDLFITVAGTLGLVGKVPPKLDGANLTENADKLTNIKCNQQFLMYVLMSPIIQRYIEAESTHNAQPKLALTRIRGFSLALPQMQEQQKIAQVLTTADKEIETLQAKLAHFQQEKKALMQQLLTGKRRVKIDDVEAA